MRAVHGEDSLAPNLIPEFERIVHEAQPEWFLMENVEGAPLPCVEGYMVRDLLLNNRWLGEKQNRVRRFSFGTRDGRELQVAGAALYHPEWEPAVCSSAGGRRASVAIGGSGKPKGNQGRGESARLRVRSLEELCELQGLPPDFLADAPFTRQGKEKVIGNGVPVPMGRAVARAVRAALEAPHAAA